jgi:hypothetical protein
MGIKLERECDGKNNVKVNGNVCRDEEVENRKGGDV